MGRPNPDRERDNQYYDGCYKVNKTYVKHPKDIKAYYFLWKKAVNYLLENPHKYVIDLGCGPSHFGRMLVSDNVKFDKYIGYDFSKVALDMARKNCSDDRCLYKLADLNKLDYIKDAENEGCQMSETLFTTFEFLEHINGDIPILEKIPVGCKVIFSVPSYYCMGHVRRFKTIEEIKDRYKMLKILDHDIKYNNKESYVFIVTAERI